MYKNIIAGIEGAQNYGLVSLVIFSLFFTGLLIWVIKVKKPYVDHMSSLPLEDDINNYNSKSH